MLLLLLSGSANAVSLWQLVLCLIAASVPAALLLVFFYISKC